MNGLIAIYDTNQNTAMPLRSREPMTSAVLDPSATVHPLPLSLAGSILHWEQLSGT